MRAQYILNGRIVFQGEHVGEFGRYTRIREPGTNRVDDALTIHVKVTETLTPGEILAAAEQGRAVEALAPWTTAEIHALAADLANRADALQHEASARQFRRARGVLETERDRRTTTAMIEAHEARCSS